MKAFIYLPPRPIDIHRLTDAIGIWPITEIICSPAHETLEEYAQIHNLRLIVRSPNFRLYGRKLAFKMLPLRMVDLAELIVVFYGDGDAQADTIIRAANAANKTCHLVYLHERQLKLV